ncbi:MAG: hypothetical protein ABI675_21050 [Chitinophagaceae bacterium]
MTRLHVLHPQSAKRIFKYKGNRIWVIFNLLFLSLTLTLVNLSPQGLCAQINVTVKYVNNFAKGYDAKYHLYNREWIRDVLTDSKRREIVATCGGSEIIRTIQIAQIPTADGQQNCPDVSVSVPQPGITALRWSVLGPHPVTGHVGIIKTVTKQLDKLKYKRSPGVNCFPAGKPLAITNKDITFKTSLSTASKTSSPPEYTIQVEALDSRGRVLHSGKSKPCVIPRTVPLVVSIGDSFSSGEGNPDEIGQASSNRRGMVACKEWTTVMMVKEWEPDMHKKPKWLEPKDHRSLLQRRH